MVKAGCAWCEKGECWSHGQIEKQSKGPKQAGAKKPQMKKGQEKPANQQQMMQMVQTLMGKQGMKQLQQMMAGTPNQQGGQQSLGEQSKMLLTQFVTQKTGEQATKEAIVYTTTQVEDVNPPQFISEVTLVSIDPDTAHKGKAQASKKAAESSAAAAALRKNGQKGGKGQPVKLQSQPKKKAKASKKTDSKKPCKWCEKGECWSHGQIE